MGAVGEEICQQISSFSLKKYLPFLPVLFILILAYCRYTYFLNPNLSGEPFIIPIQSDFNHEIAPDSIMNIKSIVTYWLLFLMGNMLFFSWTFSRDAAQGIAFFYILISLFSMTFFAIDRFIFQTPVFYTSGSNIKNFLLSPLFTGVMFVILKYARKM